MAVPISTNRVQYDGNGSQTSFPYTFRIFEDADLVVIYTSAAGIDTTWTLNTQYTVTGADLVFGGNVVVKTTPVDYTPPSGSKLTIYREVDITQESDYVENAPFHADTLEDDLDKGIMIDQQLTDQIGRAITVPASDSSPSLELPNAADRANKYLKFDASGDATAVELPADAIEDGTDHAIARYDGTTSIQGSGATLDDSGNLTTSGIFTDGAGGTSTQWNTAYSWGDHSAAGYSTLVQLIATSGVLAGALTTHQTSGDHDSRYYTQAQLNAGQLDTRYYTETEVNNLLANYATDAEVATISGDIIAQIPTDYISDAEMTVISGDIIAQIPSLAGYATELYVTTVSGDIVAQIPTDYISDAEMTVISGDIIAQIPTDYYTQGQIATISGDIVAQIPTDYISDSEMTTISGDLVLGYTAADTTLSGLLHAEIVAASGTTDHSLLTSLDYASSGHTGFQPAGDYVTSAALTTVSGDIVSQIPSLSGYATEAYVTTVSGDIVSQIPSLSGYATESYVDTVSGALHTEITNIDLSNYYTKTEVTTISGDIVSQIPTDYYTQSEVNSLITTASGDIVSQIPSLSGYATEAYVTTVSGDIVAQIPVDYVSDSEMTVISGDIVAQIPTDYYTTGEVDNLLTTTSGDILSYVSTTYIDNTEMTTISGDIVAQIPSIVTNEGIETISSGATSVSVTFSGTQSTDQYTLTVAIENTADANPSQYGYVVTVKTVNGFTLLLSAATDSANYKLNWRTTGSTLATSFNTVDFGTVLTTSGSYKGEIMTITIDDASSVFGSVLCQGADFNFDRADADSSTTAPVFCLALEAGSGSKRVLMRGQVCDTSWNWSAGKLYLSTSIGEMTQTKPSGSADQIQVLGFALSADTIWFDPVTMVAEVA